MEGTEYWEGLSQWRGLAVATMQKLWFKFKLQWFSPVIWIPALNEDTI